MTDERHAAKVRLLRGRAHCWWLEGAYLRNAEDLELRPCSIYVETAKRSRARGEMWARVAQMSWARALLLWMFGR